MPQPPMLAGQSMLTPDTIIYEAMSRVLQSRADGQGGIEAMEGLLAIVDHWKDEPYTEDLATLSSLPNDTPPEKLFWGEYKAVVRLLHRKNKWAHSPRTVKEGEEFLEAI